MHPRSRPTTRTPVRAATTVRAVRVRPAARDVRQAPARAAPEVRVDRRARVAPGAVLAARRVVLPVVRAVPVAVDRVEVGRPAAGVEAVRAAAEE